MSEVLVTAWAVARSGWRATWNRTFRFSRMKAALIVLLLQGALFWLVARREPFMADTGDSVVGLLALMALQMSWFGLMYGFTRGQMQLYQGILVPLFQMTPARPLGFLLGRVVEAVPTRAWSCLLWAWAYSTAVPGQARWAALLAMAGFGLLVGMAAHLTGLLLLSFWSRYSPKSMRYGLTLFGAVTLGLAAWAVIYLSGGGTVTDLAEQMRAYRRIVYVAVVTLGGLPGLALLVALAFRPLAVEGLYRRGVYQVLELADSEVTRPGRSLWLPLGRGAMRAVLSREWMELARSKMARVQFLIWAAGTYGVYSAGRSLSDGGGSLADAVQYLGTLSLLAWFMSYGHWVVRVFEKERKTLLLYRLAAVPAGRLLLAKFTSVFVPSALLTGISACVGGVAAGLPAGDLGWLLVWTLGALAAGTLGGFGMAAATAGEAPEEQEVDAAPRREGDSPQTTGNTWWSLARTGALVLSAALPLWTGAGQPGLPFSLPALPLLAVATVLPLAVLAAGYTFMLRTWRA